MKDFSEFEEKGTIEQGDVTTSKKYSYGYYVAND